MKRIKHAINCQSNLMLSRILRWKEAVWNRFYCDYLLPFICLLQHTLSFLRRQRSIKIKNHKWFTLSLTYPDQWKKKLAHIVGTVQLGKFIHNTSVGLQKEKNQRNSTWWHGEKMLQHAADNGNQNRHNEKKNNNFFFVVGIVPLNWHLQFCCCVCISFFYYCRSTSRTLQIDLGIR